MLEVRCPACKRVEEWDGDPVVCVNVRLEGGARRPAEPGPVAAWRTITAALEAGATVLGACPACGQPLVAEASVPAQPYAIGKVLGFDGHAFHDANGPVAADEALRRIRAALPPPPPFDPGRFAFTSLAAVGWTFGLVVWLAACAFVVFFLVRGAQQGTLWGQRGGGVYHVEP